jgi:hypothetical protein
VTRGSDFRYTVRFATLAIDFQLVESARAEPAGDPIPFKQPRCVAAVKMKDNHSSWLITI